MALPKKYRLKHKRDISLVFKERNAVKGNFLFIKHIYNKQNKYPRIGFIIPSAVYNNSVARNRIRRVLAGVVRGMISNLPQKCDMLIIVKKKREEQAIKQELIDLLKNFEKNFN